MQPKSDLTEVLNKARRERESLTERIKELNSHLQEVEGFICYVEKYLDLPQKKRSDHNIELPIENTIKPPSRRFEDVSMGNAAAIILSENGRPMHVKSIIRKLRIGGYKNPKNTSLYPTLQRRKEFCKEIEPGVFGLTEWK